MLPFIMGAAAGAVAVVALNNKKKIKKTVTKTAVKAKKAAEEGIEKSKEVAKDIKATVSEKVDCLTSKKSDTKATNSDVVVEAQAESTSESK
jgi:hypothetical protein